MIERVILSDDQRAKLELEARASAPRECCGLIEGAIEDGTLRVKTLHRTANLATTDDRFEIDPAEQFRLIRRLRGTETGIVGCYHSHPKGRAEPSPYDHAGAGEQGFVWLIVGLEGDEPALNAYVCEGARLRPIAMALNSDAIAT